MNLPKDNPDKMVSSNYIKQIAVIPGFFRKALYVTGFIFPSLGFMKNRYKTKTRLGAALYYPVRWGRSVGLYLLSGLTARRREGMKVTKRLRD
jgi:hypothetical protein